MTILEQLLPELPEALIVRRNAHGFSHSFTALQMDKYGRDCAEVMQTEVARLTAELGDLPDSPAMRLPPAAQPPRALTDAELSALHDKLGGKPDHPTYNETKLRGKI